MEQDPEDPPGTTLGSPGGSGGRPGEGPRVCGGSPVAADGPPPMPRRRPLSGRPVPAPLSGYRSYPRVRGQLQKIQFLFSRVERVIANYGPFAQVHQYLSLCAYGVPLDLGQAGRGLG